MSLTLVNLIRSMLQTNSLSKYFWADALERAAYIRSRVTRYSNNGFNLSFGWLPLSSFLYCNMESDSSSARVQKLSDNNYHSWKQKSIHFLALKDLDECIDQDPPVNAGEANRRSWNRKDRKAQEAIGLLISDELLENVPDSISAK